MKILLMTSNNINGNPRPNRLLKFLIENNYDVNLLAYHKFEGDVKQYYFKKKLKIDLINLILYLRLYKLNNDLLLFDNIDKELEKELINNNYDLIICENIELIYLANKIKNINTKIMIDLREYFPTHFDNRLFWQLRKKEYYNYLLNKYVSKADKILTVSDGIGKEYKDKYNLDCKTYLSLPEKQENKSEIKDEYSKIKIVHHGKATRERNIENMINIMDYLDDRFSLDLYLVYSDKKYYEELNNLIKNKKNINIKEAVKYEEINNMLIDYDIGLFFFYPTTFNLLNCLPNKLFEFIQAGLCLAFGPTPEIKNIIDKYDMGIISDNYEPENIANKIKLLNTEKINKYKNNSRKASKILNIETNNYQMQNILNNLLN